MTAHNSCEGGLQSSHSLSYCFAWVCTWLSPQWQLRLNRLQCIWFKGFTLKWEEGIILVSLLSTSMFVYLSLLLPNVLLVEWVDVNEFDTCMFFGLNGIPLVCLCAHVHLNKTQMINWIHVIRVLEVRVTVFFTNKNHALNTQKMAPLLRSDVMQS
jgi:hypothetical protein